MKFRGARPLPGLFFTGLISNPAIPGTTAAPVTGRRFSVLAGLPPIALDLALRVLSRYISATFRRLCPDASSKLPCSCKHAARRSDAFT